MSCEAKDRYVESLVDEFYEDVQGAVLWLENVCNHETSGLSEEEILDLFVETSMNLSWA